MNSLLRQQQNHTDSAIRLFRQSYSTVPEWKATAPGRVNLLGEHTDYNLLPVLPMTIDRSIRLYGSVRSDSRVRILNTASEFEPAELDLAQPIIAAPGHWTNYMRAAMQAVIPIISKDLVHPLRGFDVLVDSDLPPASGLSSSSALVIATCLSLLHANGVQWPALEIAERMRKAEKFVGTAGGGMDQAIIALGEKASALLIEFNPLTTTTVSLPKSMAVFVVNSGQRAEKTGPARFGYNRRALECALSVALLAQSSKEHFDTESWTSLGDVYRACQDKGVQWSSLLLEHLPVTAPTLDDIVYSLGGSRFNDLCQSRQLQLDDIQEWLPDGQFEIYNRAAHVLSEADRVYAFRDALEGNNVPVACAIAHASHASCRDLYHISTPQLETLAQHITDSGASVARITGAGFGGCLVAYVPLEQAAEFPGNLRERGIPSEHIIEAHPNGPAHVELMDPSMNQVAAPAL